MTCVNARADTPTLELLGQPCRAKNVLAGKLVKDRKGDGLSVVLTNTNEESGAELLFIDPATDAGMVYRAPAGEGSWALKEVSGNRLIVGTFSDGKYMVFDLDRMRFTKSVGVPGESFVWNLALGGDGRLYGGTYGHGKLSALDLTSYAVEDLGAPAAPNQYLRFVSSTPYGDIFCHFQTAKTINMLFDTTTHKFTPVSDGLQSVNLGATWNGYFVAGNHAYRGKNLMESSVLPFPEPPKDGGDWQVVPNLTTPETIFIQQGKAVYRYTKGDKSLTLVTETGLRGGTLLDAAPDGTTLGGRGQDYFLLTPGDPEIRLKPIPGVSSPRPTMFLRADAQGRVWGGPQFGQTLFSLDTKTKTVVNTSAITDSGGEVYDVAFRGDAVYAVAYAGGNIVRYRPGEPWDQWNQHNPVSIAGLSARGYIRPTGGILLGRDDKLYSGWMASYGKYGGAIAITDPDSGETRLVENPLGAQAVEGLAIDGSGGALYIGTSLSANGLPNKPNDAPQFGIIDLATGKPTFQKSFPGAVYVRSVRFDTKTRRVLLTVDGVLHLFDPEKRVFLDTVTAQAPRATSASVVVHYGIAYFGHDKDLCGFDLMTGAVTVIARSSSFINHVAVDDKGQLFLACGVDLYRVRR